MVTAWRAFVLSVLLPICALVAWGGPTSVYADEPRVMLGTTVDLSATGLLDALLPRFERQTGRPLTSVAVSAPQAMALGARGELDALLLDAPEDEPGYLSAGHAVERRLVMHADDVVVGPRDDPAQARAASNLDDALQRVAGSSSGWVSRADNSGMYQREQRLWRAAGIDPTGQPWYLPLGQGKIQTLVATTERQAYTLAERLSYFQQRDTLDLAVAVEGAPELLRLYSILVVNPAKGTWIDEAGARALAEFSLAADTQETIRSFGVDRFGQPVFVPAAGRTVDELLPAG
jgi:tungstate transport system substrate-binding protein